MIYEKLIKPVVDVLVSAILIVIFSPVLLFVSVCIYMDSGFPIMYRQQRVGKGNKLFGIYKFRTMVVNADQIGGTSTLKGDSRITRTGKTLRKLSLDELPQLLNVIKGDMSLIGYRPGVLSQYEEDFLESDVFKTKPGITGLAQVNGRSELSSTDKRKLEKEYAMNISFLNDLKIILLTIYKVISARNSF